MKSFTQKLKKKLFADDFRQSQVRTQTGQETALEAVLETALFLPFQMEAPLDMSGKKTCLTE